MIIFVSDLHINFNSNEDPESIWDRVERKDRAKKIDTLVMKCIVNSPRFSEYEYVEPKLLTM